jgi:hypothetical protein
MNQQLFADINDFLNLASAVHGVNVDYIEYLRNEVSEMVSDSRLFLPMEIIMMRRSLISVLPFVGHANYSELKLQLDTIFEKCRTHILNRKNAASLCAI